MTQQVKPIMHFNHDTYSIIKESDRDAFRSFLILKNTALNRFRRTHLVGPASNANMASSRIIYLSLM